MSAEYTDYGEQQGYQPNMNVRNIEEKQRLLKNQMLLVGKNLIETREKNREEILEMKKEIEKIKTNVERMSSFIKTISEEFSNFARKDDVEIINKKMRMFEPFLRKE